MHKSIPAIAGAIAIALPTTTSWAAIVAEPNVKPKLKPKKKVVISTMSYAGPAVSMRWGPVQVTAIIKTTTTTITLGKKIKKKTVAKLLTDVTATYPSDKEKSRELNSRAIPWLRQEALTRQSAQLDMVSDATMTSEVYAQSLQAALDQAQF